MGIITFLIMGNSAKILFNRNPTLQNHGYHKAGRENIDLLHKQEPLTGKENLLK